uniref:Uncharacterized protein n=1 Tax=Oncorhynchus mykiss TaxID=8022 RepID=A0A8C7VVL2_ONCMY
TVSLMVLMSAFSSHCRQYLWLHCCSRSSSCSHLSVSVVSPLLLFISLATYMHPGPVPALCITGVLLTYYVQGDLKIKLVNYHDVGIRKAVAMLWGI